MTSRNLQLIMAVATLAALGTSPVQAHHSFAMYDITRTYLLTGIVTRVDPNPNHLQIFVAPLNDERTQVLKNDKGEPVVWAVEMRSASQEAHVGITLANFPRGTIVSIGLHPLRNGFPGGGRGDNGFIRCPDDTPPAPGKHCDSVAGSKAFGKGVLPVNPDPMPVNGN